MPRGHNHSGRTSFKDLSNKTFGHWSVVSRAENAINGRTRWLCRCRCGRMEIVQSAHLVHGVSKSCGCARPRGEDHPRYKHGLGHGGGVYKIWCSMIQRCENPNTRSFKDYGARGIAVCVKWRKSFTAFAEDMGPRPSPIHTIERVNSSLGYEPDNCRWATPKEQGRNTRRNRIVEYRGRAMSLAEAAELSGVNYWTARWRVDNGRNVDGSPK